MTRQIFIVDDHPIMRRGYASLIEREPDLDICGEAGAALEALGALRNIRPDLMIIDISLGGMNGLELARRITALDSGIPILIISMHEESMYAERALIAGARGYIMKTEADRTVVDAIRRILSGGYFFSEEMSAKLFNRLSGHRPSDVPVDPVHRLSDRELEIFELLGHGRSTTEIAGALILSPKTVETYRIRIKEKLGLASGRELLLYAVRWVEQDRAADREG